MWIPNNNNNINNMEQTAAGGYVGISRIATYICDAAASADLPRLVFQSPAAGGCGRPAALCSEGCIERMELGRVRPLQSSDPGPAGMTAAGLGLMTAYYMHADNDTPVSARHPPDTRLPPTTSTSSTTPSRDERGVAWRSLINYGVNRE